MSYPYNLQQPLTYDKYYGRECEVCGGRIRFHKNNRCVTCKQRNGTINKYETGVDMDKVKRRRMMEDRAEKLAARALDEF